MKNIGGAFTALAPAKLRLWWSGWGQETEPMVGLLDSSCRLYCLSSNKTHLTSLTEQPEQHVGRSMSSTCLQRCRRQCTCQLCLATTSHCLYPLPLNNTQTGHTSCIYVYTTKTKCSRHPKYKAELATFINNKKAPPTPLLIQLHSDNLHDPAAPLATDIDQPIKSFPDNCWASPLSVHTHTCHATFRNSAGFIWNTHHHGRYFNKTYLWHKCQYSWKSLLMKAMYRKLNATSF